MIPSWVVGLIPLAFLIGCVYGRYDFMKELKEAGKFIGVSKRREQK